MIRLARLLFCVSFVATLVLFVVDFGPELRKHLPSLASLNPDPPPLLACDSNSYYTLPKVSFSGKFFVLVPPRNCWTVTLLPPAGLMISEFHAAGRVEFWAKTNDEENPIVTGVDDPNGSEVSLEGRVTALRFKNSSSTSPVEVQIIF